MELEVLDDFAPWTIYLLAFLVACGFFLSVALLIRSWLRGARRSRPATPRFSGVSLLFSVAGGLVLWFLVTSMFSAFHAVAIGADRIELIYFWPRPGAVVPRAELVDVKVVRGVRSCGYMEVLTRERIYRSVGFKRCAVAEDILKKLVAR